MQKKIIEPLKNEWFKKEVFKKDHLEEFNAGLNICFIISALKENGKTLVIPQDVVLNFQIINGSKLFGCTYDFIFIDTDFYFYAKKYVCKYENCKFEIKTIMLGDKIITINIVDSIMFNDSKNTDSIIDDIEAGVWDVDDLINPELYYL